MKSYRRLLFIIIPFLLLQSKAYAVNIKFFAPSVGTITPSYGISNPDETVVFTTTYTDRSGWKNIWYVNLLINTSINGANCFYGYYDQNTNKFYLRDDANRSWLGGYTPGSRDVIENSYVRLNCSGTTVSGFGTTLIVSWSITFKSSFTGAKGMYLYVRGDNNAYKGWTLKGKWIITNQKPSVGTITPSAGSSAPNNPVTITTTYIDPDGWLNIQYVYFLVNTSTAGTNCFYGYYNQNTNRLYLRNDTNTGWLGGYRPGSANIIENFYARLNCTGTTISGLDTTLTVNWNIEFKSTFAGNKNTYLFIKDDANAYVGWTQVGTWIIDITPPVGNIIIINDNTTYTNNLQVALTLSSTDPETGVTEMRFSNDNINWSSPEPYKTTKDWTIIPGDGAKTVYARFKNGAGLWSEVVSDEIILDTIPPDNPTINPVTSPTNQINQGITGTKSIDTDRVVVTCATAIVGEVIYPTETTWQAEISGMGEGENIINVTSYDMAGNNSNTVQVVITVDTTPPGINNIVVEPRVFSPNGDGRKDTVTFTAQLSEGADWGLDIVDNSGVIVKSFNGHSQGITQAWEGMDEGGNILNDGEYSYAITAIDTLGNRLTIPGTVEIDTLPPQNPSVNVEGGDIVHLYNIVLNLFAEGADSIRVWEGINPPDTWEVYVDTYPFTLSSREGGKNIFVHFMDEAENIASGSTYVTVDITPEAVGLDIEPNPFSPNGDGVNDTVEIFITCIIPLRWTFIIKDNLNQTVYIANTEDYETGLIRTWEGRDLNGNLLPNGGYTYYINGIDEQGNSLPEQIGVITINTQPPTGAQITIDEGEDTNNPDINLTLTCPNAAWVKISEDPQFSGVEWQEYSEHKGYRLSDGDGIKTVYAKFRDSAGNESEVVLDIITLDATPPTPPTINPVTSPTDNPVQMLSGTKSVDTVQINIYGSVQVGDIAYAPTTWQVEITLQEGFNNIQVTATDSIGNISQAASVTIYYSWNINKPIIEITSPQDNSIVNNGIITGRVSDLTSTTQVNGIPTAVNEQGVFTIELALAEGENTITAVATASQGDTGTASIRVIYDTAVPSIDITNPPDGSTINRSPIAVSGTVNELNIDSISVNLMPAVITGNEFTAEGVDLEPGVNTITAEATDKSGNTSQTSITVTLAEGASIYSLEEIEGSTIMLEEAQLPEVGTQHELKVQLLINNQPANGEIIQFQVIEGGGSLNSDQVQTDIEGEAGTLLTLGTDVETINRVQAWPVNSPEEKVEFIVIGRPAGTRQITKLTDETLTYIPGAEIELIVKVTDNHNNPIRDETINFAVLLGNGQLQQDTTTTNDIGEAYVGYIVGPVAGVINTIRASLANDPSINTTFNIQTIALPEGITVDSIINRVNENDSRIEDIQADVVITSNAPWSDPEVRLHIWQKQDKQKVQMTYPSEMTLVRPPLQMSPFNVEMQRNIIAYLDGPDIYIIKSKAIGQSESYPCEIDYVDYSRGIVIRTNYYNIDNGELTLHIIEDTDFIQIGGIWIFQRETERMYKGNNLIYTAEKVYSNIQLNDGIPDSEFE